jgi:hypothetical protein
MTLPALSSEQGAEEALSVEFEPPSASPSSLRGAGDGVEVRRAYHFVIPERGRIVVEVVEEGEEPDWLRQVVGRLLELLRLGPGWDSYAARAVNPGAVAASLALLGHLMKQAPEAPQIVPTVRGGVQLEWHLEDADVEIEVSPEGVYGGAIEDHVGSFELEVPETSDPVQVAGLTARVWRR